LGVNVVRLLNTLIIILITLAQAFAAPLPNATTVIKSGFHYIPIQAPLYPTAFYANLLANGGTIPASLTFARSSAGAYYNSSGVLMSASSGSPRWDYNPTTLAFNGLLMEPSVTNQEIYSNTPSSWMLGVGSVGTLTANAATSPDGTTDAASYSDGTSTATHLLYSTATIAPYTYAFSVYAKAGTATILQMLPSSAAFGSSAYANFKLNTGTIGSSTGCTPYIQALQNGWYRCSLVQLSSGSGTNNMYITLTNNNDLLGRNPSYLGTNETLYLYGFQTEIGAGATSYIPTTSSTVTRSADTLSGTCPWYNSAQGSMVAEFAQEATVGSGSTEYISAVSDSANSNKTVIAYNPTNGVYASAVNTGSVVYNNALIATPVFSTVYRVGLTWGTSNYASCYNGNTVNTQTSGGAPGTISIPTFYLGNNPAATNPFIGWIRKVWIWSHALPTSMLKLATK